jgi:hypothetical protein
VVTLSEKTNLQRITLEVNEFIKKYKIYRNKGEVKEFKDYISINGERIDKPESEFPGKEETIFILGDKVNDYENLIRDSELSIRNNFNVAFIELSNFNNKFNEINVGYFTIFGKLKDYEKTRDIESAFGDMINGVTGNLTMERTLHYIGLLVMSNFLKSKGFKEKLYKIGKSALDNYYLYMPKRNMELKSFNELGIVFKTGIKEIEINGKRKRVGFFEPSPSKFAEKIIEEFRRKDKKIIIFFVGINKDTKDFSSIPLNMIRSRFFSSLKKKLFQYGIIVLLSETKPITKKEGIIVMVLQKDNE